MENKETPVFGLQQYRRIPPRAIEGMFDYLKEDMLELQEKYSVDDNYSTTFVSPHMLYQEQFYIDNYSHVLVGYADYCFYSHVEDTRKVGELTKEEIAKYIADNEEEDLEDIAEIKYNNLTLYFWKGDSKGLGMRHWISNNTLDIFSVLLNINEIKKDGNDNIRFYFNCYCYVSVIISIKPFIFKKVHHVIT